MTVEEFVPYLDFSGIEGFSEPSEDEKIDVACRAIIDYNRTKNEVFLTQGKKIAGEDIIQKCIEVALLLTELKKAKTSQQKQEVFEEMWTWGYDQDFVNKVLKLLIKYQKVEE